MLILLLTLFVELNLLYHASANFAKVSDSGTDAIDSTMRVVVGESDGDMARRLRALISYLYIARVVHANTHLLFVWDINGNCPGHFLQVFEPVSNVTFISSDTKNAVTESIAVKVYPNSWDTYERTMYKNNVHLLFPGRNLKHMLWENEVEMRALIKPTKDILEKAVLFALHHRLCEALSIHVRIQDDLNPFFVWIDEKRADEVIYLVTDSRSVQQKFIDKYGSKKVLVYRMMPESLQPDDNTGDNTGLRGMNWRIHDHRFPDLEHIVIDAILSAHTQDNAPGSSSTLLEVVKWFRILYRSEWCGSS